MTHPLHTQRDRGRVLVLHAMRHLIDHHGTSSMPHISCADYNDYRALRILDALLQLHLYL